MNLHPKVKAGGITGLAYAVLVAVAAALGYAPSGLLLAVVGAALPVVAGYLKAAPATCAHVPNHPVVGTVNAVPEPPVPPTG